MPTNEFVPFATDAGANVLSPSGFAAASYRGPGFSAGLAPSDGCNTAWRQATTVAAMIGEFIKTKAGQDALDNGNVAQLLANFILGVQASASRTKLLANLNLYVNDSTGNDANSGLGSGTPFKTIQKAWATLQSNYDLNGFTVTVNVADGTYTAGLVATGPLIGQYSPAQVVFLGNVATPANCIVFTTGSNAVVAQHKAMLKVRGFRLKTATSGVCLYGIYGGEIEFDAIDFNTCVESHVRCEINASVSAVGNYSITGGAVSHVFGNSPSTLNMSGVTVTLSGTPAFSVAFASILNCTFMSAIGVTFSGAATGARYSVTNNGVINTAGGGANYFPGNSAGSTSLGGQYA